MIVYIVQLIGGSEYGCSYEDNIKGFLNQQDAINFKQDLEVRHELYFEELIELQEDHFKKSQEMWNEYKNNTSAKNKDEKMEEISEFTREKIDKERNLLEEWGLQGLPAFDKDDGFQVIELEIEE